MNGCTRCPRGEVKREPFIARLINFGFMLIGLCLLPLLWLASLVYLPIMRWKFERQLRDYPKHWTER